MSVSEISISPNPVQNVPAPSEIRSLVQDVAKRSFLELAVSLSIGTAAVFFVATPLHGTLLFALIAIQTVGNAALRLAAALAARMPECEETRRIHSAALYFRTTLFAYLTAGNAQSLLHELGHAAGAKWMFQDANPKITLTPCLGGITRFSAVELTSWGKWVGRNGAMLIVTALGPLSTLLVSAAAIVSGFALQKKFPELGYYLIGVGKGDFFAHSCYALTALSSSPGTQGHDFIRLRAHGIHPLAASITLLAIPILIAKAFEPKVEQPQPLLRGKEPGTPPSAAPPLPS